MKNSLKFKDLGADFFAHIQTQRLKTLFNPCQSKFKASIKLKYNGPGVFRDLFWR